MNHFDRGWIQESLVILCVTRKFSIPQSPFEDCFLVKLFLHLFSLELFFLEL